MPLYLRRLTGNVRRYLGVNSGFVDQRKGEIMKRTLGVLAAFAVAFIEVLTVGGVAEARAPVVAADGNYCAYYLPTKTMACVDAEEDFIWAKASALGVSFVAAARELSPAASYAWGIFYDKPGFDASGGTITFWGGHDCTSSLNDVDGGWPDTTTWRDRISSFKGLSACFIRPWGLTNFAGSTLSGFVYQKANLDALDNHVWSVQFS